MDTEDASSTERGVEQPATRRNGVVSLGRQILAGVGAIAAVALGLRLAPGPSTTPTSPGAQTTRATSPAAPTISAPTVAPATVPPTWHDQPSPRVVAGVLDGLHFTDVTRQAGLEVGHLGPGPYGASDLMTGGAAVADYDGDGDLDLYLTRVGRPNSLYRNDGGRFVDVTEASGVGGLEPQIGYAGAVWGDVDGDGDLDLFVTSAGRARNLLYINRGDGTFDEQALSRGLRWPVLPANSPGNTFSATFADIDGDGDLDLAVADWFNSPTGQFDAGGVGLQTTVPATQGLSQCERAAVIRRRGFPVPNGTQPPRTRLFLNDGSGRFSDATAKLGIDPRSMAAYTMTFSDYDGDGYPDLFVAGDFCTSRLFHNDHGQRFVDVTHRARVGTDENGMGQAIEDLNGDGRLDWIVTGILYPADAGPCTYTATVGCSGNRVYLGNADGTFTDATDALGVRDAFWAWGASAQDFTNTGVRDLAVTAGWSDPTSTGGLNLTDPKKALARRSANSPSRFWRGRPNGAERWPELANQIGFSDRGNGKALVAFDYDGDGDLDLLKVNTDGPPVLYRNDTPTGSGHHWIQVVLRDPNSGNTNGIGARVTVVSRDGKRTTAEVRAGGTFQGADPAEVHVGLGNQTEVDHIEVRWPGTRRTERFDVKHVDQRYVFDRGMGR